MTMLTISVIIPSLDSPLIDRVVERVRRQSRLPDEIIVVGMDRVGAFRNRAGVRFVETGRPVSPAAARNRGAELARGELLCFVDADCLAADDWIERMAERHAAGAQVVCGGVGMPRTGYWTLSDNLAVFGEFGEGDPPGERLHMASLNFSIRAGLFRAVGGFDESFAPSGEDTDLSFRLRRAGCPIAFEPRARVAHHHSRSSARAVWEHLRVFGAGYVGLQRAHAGLLGRSLRFELCRRRPRLAVALSPGMALLDSAQIYLRHPALLRYWYALPGVTFARLAWYVGLTFGPERLAAGALTR